MLECEPSDLGVVRLVDEDGLIVELREDVPAGLWPVRELFDVTFDWEIYGEVRTSTYYASNVRTLAAYNIAARM